MDPFTILVMMTCFVLALWACGKIPNQTLEKTSKPLPGVSDEKANKSFMQLHGDSFLSSLNGLGFTKHLGIQEFIKKNKDEK
jgi:hypothetical protein